MKVLIALIAVSVIGEISARSIGDKNHPSGESQALSTDVKELVRQKRQFGNFGQSSALANANAFNQYQGPGGFGANAANAGAQSFNSQGPLGGFGASAANSQTQGFHAGPGGIQGSAGLSGSQSYNLPGNHHVNLAYGGTFSQNNGQGTAGNSHSVTYD